MKLPTIDQNKRWLIAKHSDEDWFHTKYFVAEYRLIVAWHNVMKAIKKEIKKIKI